MSVCLLALFKKTDRKGPILSSCIPGQQSKRKESVEGVGVEGQVTCRAV